MLVPSMDTDPNGQASVRRGAGFEPPWRLLLAGLRSTDSDLRCPQEVLAAVRLGRACGYELDEATTRAVMQMVGIDPGPVWDRPLQPDPKRMPIRPDALTRFEGLLVLADAPRTRHEEKSSPPAVLCSCASSTAPDLCHRGHDLVRGRLASAG
jgi:hypothetical protein